MAGSSSPRRGCRRRCWSSLLRAVAIGGGLCAASAAALTAQHRLWPAGRLELYTDVNDADEACRGLPLYTVSLAAWTNATPATAKAPQPPHRRDGNDDDDAERFEFACEGSCSEAVQAVLSKAQKRFFQALRRQRPANYRLYPVNPHQNSLWPLRGVKIRIASSSDVRPRHGADESYALQVPPVVDGDAHAHLEAPTVLGALHGLQSLLQLLEFAWIDPHGDEPSSGPQLVHVVRQAPLQIYDAPAYPYRGLLVDTSRHYLPLPLLLRTLDALELNKLNVLHWHVTDSQSWPYRSKMYPELADRGGSYCPDCVYDPSDVRRVVAEAADRGIRVVLEFDLPGHCQSIGASHPELLTDCGSPRGPSEPLDATKNETWDFVANLYREIDGLMDRDAWIHVGGDEIPLECWHKSESVQRWMRQHNVTDERQLLNGFESRLLDLVAQTLRKTPIVWQELFDAGLDLPPETVVDVWKEWDTAARETATAQGYRVLFSACWYLDHLNEDWRSFYDCNPRAFNATSEEQLARVSGGHASMWGERVDDTDFEPRVWPRASAAAERLWTGHPDRAAATTTEDRLDRFRCLMVQRGIVASPVRPGSCERAPPTLKAPDDAAAGSQSSDWQPWVIG